MPLYVLLNLLMRVLAALFLQVIFRFWHRYC